MVSRVSGLLLKSVHFDMVCIVFDPDLSPNFAPEYHSLPKDMKGFEEWATTFELQLCRV